MQNPSEIAEDHAHYKLRDQLFRPLIEKDVALRNMSFPEKFTFLCHTYNAKHLTACFWVLIFNMQ